MPLLRDLVNRYAIKHGVDPDTDLGAGSGGGGGFTGPPNMIDLGSISDADEIPALDPYSSYYFGATFDLAALLTPDNEGWGASWAGDKTVWSEGANHDGDFFLLADAGLLVVRASIFAPGTPDAGFGTGHLTLDGEPGWWSYEQAPTALPPYTSIRYSAGDAGVRDRILIAFSTGADAITVPVPCYPSLRVVHYPMA